jgi:hypothetical protein
LPIAFESGRPGGSGETLRDRVRQAERDRGHDLSLHAIGRFMPRAHASAEQIFIWQA